MNVTKARKLRDRYAELRRKIKKCKNRPRAFNYVYHLHVFPGEHLTAIPDIHFDEPQNSDPLQTENIALQHQLVEAKSQLAEKEASRSNLESQVNTLVDQNQFLSNHCVALEQEVSENFQQISQLKHENQELKMAAAAAEKKGVLGKKKLFDLSESAVNQTKAALRDRAVESLNAYARNRGIVVNQVVFQDENGQQLKVNASKRNTYETLNTEEMKNVRKASQWKDQNYVSDDCYAKLGKVGSFPPASHLKSYESELNAKIGPILAVNIFVCDGLVTIAAANFHSTCFKFYTKNNIK